MTAKLNIDKLTKQKSENFELSQIVIIPTPNLL